MHPPHPPPKSATEHGPGYERLSNKTTNRCSALVWLYKYRRHWSLGTNLKWTASVCPIRADWGSARLLLKQKTWFDFPIRLVQRLPKLLFTASGVRKVVAKKASVFPLPNHHWKPKGQICMLLNVVFWTWPESTGAELKRLSTFRFKSIKEFPKPGSYF